MLDTTPKLAQCQKCQAYVFDAQVNGCRVMVDPTPVTAFGEVVAALGTGKAMYDARRVGGKVTRLAVAKSPMGPKLMAHGCTVSGVVRATPVEVAPEGPQRAPVTPGGLPGGFRPAPAPASGSQGHTAPHSMPVARAPWPSRPPSPATHANRPPSDLRDLRYIKPTRCDICRKLITVESTGVCTIEYDGRIIYGVHQSC